jgi:hypothetical protein
VAPGNAPALIGFLAGHIVVPDDFDRLGESKIVETAVTNGTGAGEARGVGSRCAFVNAP